MQLLGPSSVHTAAPVADRQPAASRRGFPALAAACCGPWHRHALVRPALAARPHRYQRAAAWAGSLDSGRSRLPGACQHHHNSFPRVLGNVVGAGALSGSSSGHSNTSTTPVKTTLAQRPDPAAQEAWALVDRRRLAGKEGEGHPRALAPCHHLYTVKMHKRWRHISYNLHAAGASS
jgi:hypothetical protein